MCPVHFDLSGILADETSACSGSGVVDRSCLCHSPGATDLGEEMSFIDLHSPEPFTNKNQAELHVFKFNVAFAYKIAL